MSICIKCNKINIKLIRYYKQASWNDRVRIVQNHLEALYLRAFFVPFWARENILKTHISILGRFLLSVTRDVYGMALAYGAQRDEANKALYVEQEDMPYFAFLLSNGTIRCERLYLLEKEMECWSCHKKTTNYMLATDQIVDPFTGARDHDFKIFTFV